MIATVVSGVVIIAEEIFWTKVNKNRRQLVVDIAEVLAPI
jgi:hypothetical protein